MIWQTTEMMTKTGSSNLDKSNFHPPGGIVKFRGWKKSGGVWFLDTVHEDGARDHFVQPSRSIQRSPFL
jgi:hypothetical protein